MAIDKAGAEALQSKLRGVQTGIAHSNHYGGGMRNVYSDSGTSLKLPNLEKKCASYATESQNNMQMKTRMVNKILGILPHVINEAIQQENKRKEKERKEEEKKKEAEKQANANKV